VQECLTNIHRHSESKTALIRVEHEHGKIHVLVQDEGKGMSHQKLAAIQSQGSGVGIRGMRERVHYLGGELTIESNNSGTKVSAVFPAKSRRLTDQGTVQQVEVA